MTTPIAKFDTSKIPAQRQFMESTTKELMFSGAFGASKSRTGCEKALFLSLRYPGNRGLILRRTYASLRYTTMDTFFRYTAPQSIIPHSYNQESHICTLDNGSEILFLGLDDPLKIGSLEVGWIFVDEVIELDEEDYTMLLGRLRLTTVPFRQMFMATNPASPQHYLYKRFYLDNDSDREVIESNTLDNPFLPDDYKATLMKFTGRYRDRYVFGKWIGFEGLVYDHIEIPDLVIPPFEIPSHWPRYRSIDFGYTNPFVCQWWACCPKDEETDDIKGYYLYREIYYSKRIVETHAARIKSYPEFVSDTFADHDAEDRATLDDKSVDSTIANKAVGPGIQTTYELLGDGKVHIFDDALVEVDDDLQRQSKPTSTAEEFGNYRWSDKRKNQNDRETPQDKDNHGMDAMRYFLHTLLSEAPPVPVMYKTRNQTPATPKREWGKFLTTRNWRSR